MDLRLYTITSLVVFVTGLNIFAKSGKLTLNILSGDDQANSAWFSREGSLYLGGSAHLGNDPIFAWAKLDEKGSVLQREVTSAGSGQSTFNSIAVDDESRLVGGGWAFVGNTKFMALARYEPNGKLDRNFANGGIFTHQGQMDASIRSLTVGKGAGQGVITAVGSVNKGNLNGFVTRVSERGHLDTSFSTDSTAIFNPDVLEVAHSVEVGTQGSIWIAGRADYNGTKKASLVRLLTSGEFDTAFSKTGQMTFNFGGKTEIFRKVVLNEYDETVYIGGYTQQGGRYEAAVARVKYDGTLDTTFHNNGVLIIPLSDYDSGVADLALDSKKRLVILGSGYNGSNWDFVLTRVLKDGSIDKTFGDEGKTVVAFGAGDDQGTSLIMKPEDKFCAVGTSHNGSNNDMAISCFTNKGKLDHSFGAATY